MIIWGKISPNTEIFFFFKQKAKRRGLREPKWGVTGDWLGDRMDIGWGAGACVKYLKSDRPGLNPAPFPQQLCDLARAT